MIYLRLKSQSISSMYVDGKLWFNYGFENCTSVFFIDYFIHWLFSQDLISYSSTSWFDACILFWVAQYMVYKSNCRIFSLMVFRTFSVVRPWNYKHRNIGVSNVKKLYHLFSRTLFHWERRTNDCYIALLVEGTDVLWNSFREIFKYKTDEKPSFETFLWHDLSHFECIPNEHHIIQKKQTKCRSVKASHGRLHDR